MVWFFDLSKFKAAARPLPICASNYRCGVEAETCREAGLVVVGVHTSEFGFERSTTNVQAAIKRLGVKHPEAQDKRYATWKAYAN